MKKKIKFCNVEASLLYKGFFLFVPKTFQVGRACSVCVCVCGHITSRPLPCCLDVLSCKLAKRSSQISSCYFRVDVQLWSAGSLRRGRLFAAILPTFAVLLCARALNKPLLLRRTSWQKYVECIYIYIFFFPSHTSIYRQSEDLFSKDILQEIKKIKRFNVWSDLAAVCKWEDG